MQDLTDLHMPSMTLKHLPCMPCLTSFSRSPALHTMSKALRKSINAQNSFFLEFNTESIKHLRLNICSDVEYPFLKPACTCDKMLSSSINFVILLLIMQVRSLPKQQSDVSVIVWLYFVTLLVDWYN